MSFTLRHSCYNLRSSALSRRMPNAVGPNSTVEICLIKKYRCITRNHQGDEILIGVSESLPAVQEFPFWFEAFFLPLNLSIFINCALLLSPVSSTAIPSQEFISLKQQMYSFAKTAAEEATNEGRNSVKISFKVFTWTNLICNDEDSVHLLRAVAGWENDEGRFRGVPTPISAIEALETEIVDGQYTTEDCRICLDEFFNGVEVIRMPCSHVFHSSCISRWLEASNSCPLCRVRI